MKKTLVVFRRFVGDEKLPEVYRGIILSRYIGIILSIGIYIEKKVMGIKGAKPPPNAIEHPPGNRRPYYVVLKGSRWLIIP